MILRFVNTLVVLCKGSSKQRGYKMQVEADYNEAVQAIELCDYGCAIGYIVHWHASGKVNELQRILQFIEAYPDPEPATFACMQSFVYQMIN
jgi:hypothetical protein